jgi:hypothetical protein
MPGGFAGSFTAGVASARVLDRSHTRKRITFYPPATNRVTVSPRAAPSAIDAGPTLQQAGANITFQGPDAMSEFFAIANVAGVTIGFYEEFY